MKRYRCQGKDTVMTLLVRGRDSFNGRTKIRKNYALSIDVLRTNRDGGQIFSDGYWAGVSTFA
jgi:hypothetical protein